MIIRPFISKEVENLDCTLHIQEKRSSLNIHLASDVLIFNNLIFSDSILENNMNYYKRFVSDNFLKIMFNTKYEKLYGTYIFAQHRHTNNYSHFMHQIFGFLLLCKKLNIFNSNIKIIFNNSPSKFHFQLFDLFNIDYQNFLFLPNDKVFICEKLLYHDSFFTFLFPKDFIKIYEDEFLNLKIKNKEIYEKIYITRINQPRRKAVNEAEIIKFLHRKNFKILDFDKLSVKEQIYFINTSKIIVSSHGASGANLLYKNKDNFKFIECFHEKWIKNFHVNTLLYKNCNYAATINPIINANDNKISPWLIDYKIDKEILNIALEENSFIFKHSLNNIDVNKEIINFSKILSLNTPTYFTDSEKFDHYVNTIDINSIVYLLNKQIKKDPNDYKLCLSLIYYTLLNNDVFNLYYLLYKYEDSLLTNSYFDLLYIYIYKLFDFKKFNNLYSKYHNILPDKYKNLLDSSKKINLNALLTWHNTTLSISEDLSRVIHAHNKSALSIELENDFIYFFIKSNNCYIANIDYNGFVKFSKNKKGFKIENFGKCGLTIKNNINLFLCALRDGSISWRSKPLDRERFFYNK